MAPSCVSGTGPPPPPMNRSRGWHWLYGSGSVHPPIQCTTVHPHPLHECSAYIAIYSQGHQYSEITLSSAHLPLSSRSSALPLCNSPTTQAQSHDAKHCNTLPETQLSYNYLILRSLGLTSRSSALSPSNSPTTRAHSQVTEQPRSRRGSRNEKFMKTSTFHTFSFSRGLPDLTRGEKMKTCEKLNFSLLWFRVEKCKNH